MLERPFWYAAAESLSANQTIYDRRTEIRPTADFYARAMALYTSTNAIAGRFKRADGAYFTGPDFFHLDGWVHSSGGARWTPFLRQLRYPANGAFVYDLQDLGGAGDPTIYPVLLGVERYSEMAAAPHPANYIEEDYSISIQQTISGAGTQLLSIPLFCSTGEAFEIRTMSWSYQAGGNVPLTMHFRLWDHNDQLFSNTWVPVRALFSGPLSTDPPYPATVFPGMVIPPSGRFKLDLWNRTEAGPFTVDLTFSGVRMVGVA